MDAFCTKHPNFQLSTTGVCSMCEVDKHLPAPAEPPEHILQFFGYSHLPAPMQGVSKPFSDLAQRIVAEVPRNPERTVALRKLLEAKDAAVRAALAK
jgi:hypothetical protein